MVPLPPSTLYTENKLKQRLTTLCIVIGSCGGGNDVDLRSTRYNSNSKQSFIIGASLLHKNLNNKFLCSSNFWQIEKLQKQSSTRINRTCVECIGSTVGKNDFFNLIYT